MTMQTRFRSRNYTDEDLQAVCDLLNACDTADKLDDNYSPEDLRREFDDPDLDKHKDLRIWEDAGGRLVGFGQLWLRSKEDEAQGGLYIRIHPDTRDQGLEPEVLDWAEQRLREAHGESGKPLALQGWTRQDYPYMREIFEQAGFAPARYFFEMVRPLNEDIPEPVLPEGFTTRHITSEDPPERWVEMFNQSFIDHWNHHPSTVEAHKHWLENPKYVPERDLIAIAPDGTFAAFCFCWVDPEDNERNNRSEGWIDMLGTRRGYRNIGLGRAMLLSGLHRLKSEGLDTAKLGVDAENPTGALGLYERAGFVARTRSMVYRKAL